MARRAIYERWQRDLKRAVRKSNRGSDAAYRAILKFADVCASHFRMPRDNIRFIASDDPWLPDFAERDSGGWICDLSLLVDAKTCFVDTLLSMAVTFEGRTPCVGLAEDSMSFVRATAGSDWELLLTEIERRVDWSIEGIEWREERPGSRFIFGAQSG